jgi:hypothetical protein
VVKVPRWVPCQLSPSAHEAECVEDRPANQEIICITTASNRHLRRALLGGSTSSSLSPTDYSFSPTEPIFSSISSLSDADGDEPGIPRLELHAHPKSGVPMTVTVYPVLGVSESGKPIRIDMLQAGEYVGCPSPLSIASGTR